MVNAKIILFIFCFNLISQDFYNFYDSISRGTSRDNFRNLLARFPDDEIDVQVEDIITYGDYSITPFKFNDTEINELGKVPIKCKYRFNICEFVASRFANNYDKLKEIFEVIHEVKPHLLQKPGILERLLCPWIPHQILSGSEPNYKSVDFLLKYSADPSSEELGATPLHFLLDFKANNPNFPDDEFRRIFLLLRAKNAKRKILNHENKMEDLMHLDTSDPQMHKIFLQNTELAVWIIRKYY